MLAAVAECLKARETVTMLHSNNFGKTVHLPCKMKIVFILVLIMIVAALGS